MELPDTQAGEGRERIFDETVWNPALGSCFSESKTGTEGENMRSKETNFRLGGQFFFT